MPPPETKEAQMSPSEYKAAEDLNKKLKEKVKELKEKAKELESEQEALKRNIALMKALQVARDGMSRQN
jgi:Skp family chaperone for outer membrane proteins